MALNDIDFDFIEQMAYIANRASKCFDEPDSDLNVTFEDVPDDARKRIVLSIMSVCNEVIEDELAKCE